MQKRNCGKEKVDNRHPASNIPQSGDRWSRKWLTKIKGGESFMSKYWCEKVILRKKSMVRSTVQIDLEIGLMTLIGSRIWSCGNNFWRYGSTYKHWTEVRKCFLSCGNDLWGGGSMEECERTFWKVWSSDLKGRNSERYVCSVFRDTIVERSLNVEKYLSIGLSKKEDVSAVQIAWSESETSGCDIIQWEINCEKHIRMARWH